MIRAVSRQTSPSAGSTVIADDPSIAGEAYAMAAAILRDAID